MAALRNQSETNPSYPPVLLAFRGEPSHGEAFFRKHWPAARAIADPDGSLYESFGIQRANLSQAFGRPVVRRAFEAFRRGFGVGIPGRDPLRMPGLFLIRKPRLLAARRFSHVGDQPNFSELVQWAASFDSSALSGESDRQRID